MNGSRFESMVVENFEPLEFNVRDLLKGKINHRGCPENLRFIAGNLNCWDTPFPEYIYLRIAMKLAARRLQAIKEKQELENELSSLHPTRKTAAPVTTQPSSPLLNLPVEILHIILDYIRLPPTDNEHYDKRALPDFLSLRLTCRRLYTLANDPNSIQYYFPKKLVLQPSYSSEEVFDVPALLLPIPYMWDNARCHNTNYWYDSVTPGNYRNKRPPLTDDEPNWQNQNQNQNQNPVLRYERGRMLDTSSDVFHGITDLQITLIASAEAEFDSDWWYEFLGRLEKLDMKIKQCSTSRAPAAAERFELFREQAEKWPAYLSNLEELNLELFGIGSTNREERLRRFFSEPESIPDLKS